MAIIFGAYDKREPPDQKVDGLGYISRDGENFLPAIVRLEELLSGTSRVECLHGGNSMELSQTPLAHSSYPS